VAWIYTDSISDTGGIVSNGQGSWYFRHKSARLNFLDSNEADILTGSSDLSTGAWFHSAVTLSGDATATIILYKNGSSDGTTTTTRSFTATSTYAAIGCDVQSAGGRLDSEGFDGLMTEVAVFSDVLLSTEINDIKDNGLSPVTASAEGSVFQDFYAEDLTTL
jgi:hypothetical protein